MATADPLRRGRPTYCHAAVSASAARRDEVLAALARIGAKDPRVFGSVARGEDDPGSNLDLLVTFPPDAGIVTLLTLEEELANIGGSFAALRPVGHDSRGR